MENRSPLFREIHKNSWLKRVIDNRKIPVGPKVGAATPRRGLHNCSTFAPKRRLAPQSRVVHNVLESILPQRLSIFSLFFRNKQKPEKFWVVFCVHDDCQPLLEGYTEPRQASTHVPEWTVSLLTTLHISHTLVPSEQEYEFVITLQKDTVRFHAQSW